MSEQDKFKVAKAVKKAAKAARSAHAHAAQLELELVQFKTGDRSIGFNIDVTAETVWATQQQIADLFETDKLTISEHIRAILAEDELDEASVVGRFLTNGTDGTSYEVLHYNLDMILSVGYRVSSPKATQFRKWATQTLKSYIVDGYALDESRLRNDPRSLAKLAARIRELRADEKNIYEAVRHCFKESSIDYDSGAQACRTFYATLQDKFLYAITQKTASELILNRADHKEPNMGVQHYAGNLPKKDEIQIGKNYLDKDELYRMHILCEQFLLFAESSALRGKQLTMKQMAAKLDDLLKLNEYPVFSGYKEYLKDRATRHAQAEFARFLMRLKADDVKVISKR